MFSPNRTMHLHIRRKDNKYIVKVNQDTVDVDCPNDLPQTLVDALGLVEDCASDYFRKAHQHWEAENIKWDRY